MAKDPVRSLYQCEALHGSYTRCTGVEGHAGAHSNGSYVWTDKPSPAQVAKFQEVVSARTAKVLEFADKKES